MYDELLGRTGSKFAATNFAATGAIFNVYISVTINVLLISVPLRIVSSFCEMSIDSTTHHQLALGGFKPLRTLGSGTFG